MERKETSNTATKEIFARSVTVRSSLTRKIIDLYFITVVVPQRPPSPCTNKSAGLVFIRCLSMNMITNVCGDSGALFITSAMTGENVVARLVVGCSSYSSLREGWASKNCWTGRCIAGSPMYIKNNRKGNLEGAFARNNEDAKRNGRC